MSRRRDESGSATLLVLAMAGVLMFLGAALAVVTAMVAAHRSAQAAADLSALAGARGVAEGRDGCASAAEVAAANRAVRHPELGQAPGSVCRRLLEGLAVRVTARPAVFALQGPKPPTLATVPDGATSAGPGQHEPTEQREGRCHAEEEERPCAQVDAEERCCPARAEHRRQDRHDPSGEEEQAEDHHPGRLPRWRVGEKHVEERDGTGLVQRVVLVAALG